MSPGRRPYPFRVVLPKGFMTGLLVAGGVLAGLYMGRSGGRPAGRPRPASHPGGGHYSSPVAGASDWFMTLRLPEVYASAKESATAGAKISEWIGALKRAGFQPVLLSDVMIANQSRERLPDKALVLMVQPGYKNTREALAPVLAKQNCPVLWLTDEEAMDRKDRRYISGYDAIEMKTGGLFDLGFFRGPAASFTLDPAFRNRSLKGETVQLAPGAGDGRTAINFQDNSTKLNRLNVNLRWSGEQLVQRLLVEMPIRERSRLTVLHMAGRTWGVFASPLLPDAPARFTLQAAPGARSASLRWDGTVGLQDIQVDLDAEAINGDLWVYLRYDRDTGDGVMVGLSQDRVIVQQSSQGRTATVLTLPWARPTAESISAKMTLVENRLDLSVEGMGGRTVDLPEASLTSKGTLGLMVSDRISGVAQAKGVQLYATPLAKQY